MQMIGETTIPSISGQLTKADSNQVESDYRSGIFNVKEEIELFTRGGNLATNKIAHNCQLLGGAIMQTQLTPLQQEGPKHGNPNSEDSNQGKSSLISGLMAKKPLIDA